MISIFKRRPFAAALVLIMLASSVALGEIVFDALSELPPGSAPVAILGSPLAIADAANYDTPVRPRLVKGNTKVVFAPTFSIASSTATFEVVLYHRNGSTDTFWTIVGPITVTAKSSGTVGGRYPSKSENVLATLGAQVYDVRLVSISAGNVTWTQAAVGADTKTAGTASE